jgi:putative ABC transport system permease protein
MPAAVGIALLAGLLFSLLPARRAAALDPVLALRGQDQ